MSGILNPTSFVIEPIYLEKVRIFMHFFVIKSDILSHLWCHAAVTELADVQDLGSCVARREGSTPFGRSSYLHRQETIL